MSERLETSIVGDIVAADFRAAGVFSQFGIDFCCGGRRSLADACRTASVDPASVLGALEALPPLASDSDKVAGLPLDGLIDHIVSTHHAYLRSALPAITGYLEKLVQVHGARHPELMRVSAHFDRMRQELQQHMMKEEQVLFPYIRDLATRGDVCGRTHSPFGTVENPIRMMEREHRDAADEMEAIRDLTGAYTPPADGCTTYAVCMQELAHFERDLHRHVHLENNVLFPRAVDLERSCL